MSGPLFKTNCFQMYGIVSAERKRRHISHWHNWNCSEKAASANQSQSLQCICFFCPLLHSGFFLCFQSTTRKTDILPVQFLSQCNRTLFAALFGVRRYPYSQVKNTCPNELNSAKPFVKWHIHRMTDLIF